MLFLRRRFFKKILVEKEKRRGNLFKKRKAIS